MRAALGLVTIALLLAATPASAAPPTGGGWFHVRAGLAFADNVQVLDDFLGATDEPGPYFGISGFWRSRFFDLGGSVEHTVGSRFDRFDSKAPIGSHTRIGASARWRFINGDWGATYLRAGAGYGIYVHGPAFAFEVGRVLGVGLAQVDEITHAFDVTVDLGALLWAGDDAAVHLDFGLAAGVGAVAVEGADTPYIRVRALLALGVEWAF